MLNKKSCSWCSQGFLVFGLTLAQLSTGIRGESLVLADIQPDSTLGNEASQLKQGVDINGATGELINGGAVRGANLFHSFSEFNVADGQLVYFSNPTGVENIFTRVIGNSRSEILGKLGVLGNANLFLINPNGILFGQNAQLDINGSFVASTADSLVFGNNFAFSASNPQALPLLTINVPFGLQFGAAPGSIVNRSITTDTNGQLIGLQVPLAKTLALVGGDIALEGGYLTAESGRIELGSVATNNLVRITSNAYGWALDYSGVTNFRDINLFQGAQASITGNGGNAIQVQGRNLTFREGAQLVADTNTALGGSLIVNASESVELTGTSADAQFPSALLARTGGAGNAGDINITTKRLNIGNTAGISTATLDAGNAGNVTVNASELVEVSGSNDDTASYLNADAQPNSIGNAGNVSITTKQLIVRDGGQVSSTTFGSGNGGNLTVIASDFVDVIGVNPSDTFSSTLATQSDQTATGFSGNLRIETQKLAIRDGAFVSASNRGQGRGGKLEIIATKSVEVTGVSFLVDYPTYLQIDGLGRGGAGDLFITTPSLLVDDRARISVASIFGEGGNIFINAGTVILNHNAVIESDADPSAKAFPKPDITIDSTANGGNTIINADNLVLANNSSIVANAVKGQGGNIRIRVQGFFVSPDSVISANSQLGIDGVVEINKPDADPSRGLVTLPTNLVDASGLIAQNCSVGGATTALQQSEFVVTGRGGLPPNPSEPLTSDAIWQDLQPHALLNEKLSNSQEKARISQPPTAIVEAQGWVIGADGDIILVAQAPTVTPNNSSLTPVSCPVAQN
ncbi:filamentous hemagglutinin N-terminal domain-containing protein [Dendronalium sp. ChiSLP03b]|uniref:two-partner secretion domain-containing protein n=1 Tax=Dendronalium sp. ChiSLP03b TaxID=3075381 RepID=UPI002AD1F445|nr:filamentous hemagglutinin N-terminal domain-containing protein [Dendronalium sp. ChiSLP03b]MDZ8205206.1 filamentous hemagglutinin N-terminal domain-containing protein [Dendronalium sp. ChiSLP03b]